MLTEEQKNKYLISPYLCPYCGSDELSLGKVTADINRAVQNISCSQCKKRWTNVYALTHIEEDEWDMRKGEIKTKLSKRSRVAGKTWKEENRMKVVKMDNIPKEVLMNPIFTGREVTRQVLLPESKEYEVDIINFGKGVRNKFHAHDYEQILIVIAGKGVVATEKEEKVVTVGDIVLIPAGEKHWHGSGGDSEFSHIFVVRKEDKVKQLED